MPISKPLRAIYGAIVAPSTGKAGWSLPLIKRKKRKKSELFQIMGLASPPRQKEEALIFIQS
jgi:hypothetical protein